MQLYELERLKLLSSEFLNILTFDFNDSAFILSEIGISLIDDILLAWRSEEGVQGSLVLFLRLSIFRISLGEEISFEIGDDLFDP